MLPVLFHVGKFPVHSWGILLMIGFLLGTWRAAKHSRNYGIAPEDLWDAALFGLFGGVIGGRLAYVFNPENFSHFMQHPAEIFALWTGGMTSFGGLIGGVAVGLIVARLRKFNPLDGADLAAPSLAIGYFWGRIGCFLNGCCYGGHCDAAWAVSFPGHDGALGTGPVHPTQLYSAAAGAIIYFVLVAMEKRRHFRGQMILVFCMLYALYRFIVEFFREGATAHSSGIAALTQGQVACLVIALIAGVYYAFRMRSTAEPVLNPSV